MSRARRGATRRRAVVVALTIAAMLVPTACTSREDRLTAARDRAVDYFARDVEAIEVGWSAIFAYLQRRFGLDVEIADGSTIHDTVTGIAPPEMFAIFRRLIDGSTDVRIQQIADLESPIDRISASAIHCDHIALPDDWVDILFAATGKGAYALTHAVAAAQWTLENGCRSELELTGLHVAQVEALRAMLEDPGALERRHAAALDIWIEGIVMLFYAGAGEQVEPAWVDAVLALQREDGGWPAHPRASKADPHATALAVWVILEALEPGSPRVSWIPPH